MSIKLEKPTSGRMEQLGLASWPVWTKEISEFPWYYDATEDCYILEGQVIVTPEGGEPVEINAGDYVTFPQGMACHWNIIQPIRKHYRFR